MRLLRRKARKLFQEPDKGLFVITKKQFRPMRAVMARNNVFYSQASFGPDGIVTPPGYFLTPRATLSSCRATI